MIPSTSTTLLRQIGGDVRHARWAEFVARYSPMCRHYLRRHFPSLEAEDILQETFAALAKALPNYHYDPQEKGHFRNYLVGILRNKALMALRKQKRDEEVLAEYVTAGGSRLSRPKATGGRLSSRSPCSSSWPIRQSTTARSRSSSARQSSRRSQTRSQRHWASRATSWTSRSVERSRSSRRLSRR